MKICVIGDPHGDLKKIKKIPLSNVDLILVTGDLGKSESIRKRAFEDIEREKKGLPEKEYSIKEEKKQFMELYGSSVEIIKYLKKFAPVFTIFGNLEHTNDETRDLSEEIGIKLPFLKNKLNSWSNVRVINNRDANFKGVRIGGLGYFTDTVWVKNFKPADYEERMFLAKESTEKAKRILKWFDKVDILVCHQPPYKILDKVTAKFAPKDWYGKNAGSKAILQYIKSKKPKYVFCGHIHEAKGKEKIGKTEVYNLGLGDYEIIEF